MIRRVVNLICDNGQDDLLPLLDSALTSPRLSSFLRCAALEEDMFAERFQLLQTSASSKKATGVYLEKVLQKLVDPEDSYGMYYSIMGP